MTRAVFKIARASEWSAAEASGSYSGSPDDLRDGYIHLSAAGQVIETLRKHFRGEQNLIIAAFQEDALAPLLKWETSRNGELFPHAYGGLPTSAALWVRPIALDEFGNSQLKESDFAC